MSVIKDRLENIDLDNEFNIKRDIKNQQKTVQYKLTTSTTNN